MTRAQDIDCRLPTPESCATTPTGALTQQSHGAEYRPMQNMSHILIVDDDLEIRKLLGRYLTEQGYRVSIASDQRTMKEALQTKSA
jgi:two-component system OmpR family response regulator